MAEPLVLAPKDEKLLEHHLSEWTHWRQTQDPDTADGNWDAFIQKSREKARWQAGLAEEIDGWESLHQLQLELQDRLAGQAHGGQTTQ